MPDFSDRMSFASYELPWYVSYELYTNTIPLCNPGYYLLSPLAIEPRSGVIKSK